jgi:hypothetical protein
VCVFRASPMRPIKYLSKKLLFFCCRFSRETVIHVYSPLFNRSGILKYLTEFPSRGASLIMARVDHQDRLIWKRHQTDSNTDSYDNYDDDLSSFHEIIRHRPRHKFHFNRLFKIFDLPYKPANAATTTSPRERRAVAETAPLIA